MDQLLADIEKAAQDFILDATMRLEKNNKAAGARSRKASLELTKLFKEWRKLSVKN